MSEDFLRYKINKDKYNQLKIGGGFTDIISKLFASHHGALHRYIELNQIDSAHELLNKFEKSLCQEIMYKPVVNNEGFRSMEYAIKFGNLEFVKLLFEKGFDINKISDFDILPLTVAIQYNNNEIIEFLLNNGANCNILSSSFHIIEKDYIKKLEPFSKSDVINLNFKEKYTPIHIIAMTNNMKNNRYIGKLLIEKGADINIKTNKNNTPLILSISLINVDFTHFLINEGADINLRDGNNDTPLIIAMHYGFDDNVRNIINLLLSTENININIKGDKGQTAICRIMTLSHVHNKIIYLLNNQNFYDKIDINISDDNGLTPLHYAIKFQDYEILEKILDKSNIDINVQDNDKNTPLHYAAIEGVINKVQKLVERGAEIMLRNNHNHTCIDVCKNTLTREYLIDVEKIRREKIELIKFAGKN